MMRRLLMVIMITGGFSAALPAHAQMPAPYAAAELHASVAGMGDAKEIPFLLTFTLQPGWYMYWRTPGDSGLAPDIQSASSVNVQSMEIGWPAPKRFEEQGMYSFGYDGTVSIPLTFVPAAPGKAMTAALDISLIVCNKICVPQNLSVNAAVPEGAAVPTAHAQHIKNAFSSLPVKNGGSNDFRIDTAVLGTSSLVLTLYSNDGFEGTDIFVESDDAALSAVPQMQSDGANPHVAIFTIAAPDGTDNLAAQLLGKTVTVTAVKGGKAAEKNFSF